MDRARTTRTSRTSRPAFTLVELVIVVLILGILAAAGAPRFAASLQHHRADAAAARVAADLRLARTRARSESRDKTVSFDPASGVYSVFPGVDDPDHPGRAYQVDLTRPPYHAALLSADFNGAADVTFNGFGLPDQGGVVVVGAGAEQRTIVVDSQTGEVTIP